MMTKVYTFFIIILFGSLELIAQKTYYYYNNDKFYLNLDTEFISINSTSSNTSYLSTSATKHSGVSDVTEDYTRKYLNNNNLRSSSRTLEKKFYYEVKLDDNVKSNEHNYYNFINKLNKYSFIIKVSPCFKTKKGKRIGLTNNFYVKLKKSSDTNLLHNYANKLGLEVLGNDPYMPLWYVVSCTKFNKKNSLEYANIFHETYKFAVSEPEFVYHKLLSSNDPFYKEQWGLSNTGQHGVAFKGIDINVEKTWSLSKGDKIKVAIYDHGFEMDHPDLADNVIGSGFDATTGTSPSRIRGVHGTPCAGIIGAGRNNKIGISGVAPKAHLTSISINLLFSDTPLQIASGFSWAKANGVDVISNSWGGYTPSNIITDAISKALKYGRNGKGCVIVFAAGNENNIYIRYPGNAIKDIIVVGAMSPCGERKNPNSCDTERWGSCFGNELDVVAPGVLIPTTDRQGSEGYNKSSGTSGNYMNNFSGTSSAAPHVAGVAALILSANPNLTVKQVNNIIECTAKKVGNYTYATHANRPNGTWNNEMGYGLIDAYAAVKMAKPLIPSAEDICKDALPPNVVLELDSSIFKQNFQKKEKYLTQYLQIVIDPNADNCLSLNEIQKPSCPENIITSTKWFLEEIYNNDCPITITVEENGLRAALHGDCDNWSAQIFVVVSNQCKEKQLKIEVKSGSENIDGSLPNNQIQNTSATYSIVSSANTKHTYKVIPKISTSQLQNYNVKIWVQNQYGNIVYQTSQPEFDLSNLEFGIYIIKGLVNNETFIYKKILK